MLLGACWIPRSSNTDTLAAVPMHRARHLNALVHPATLRVVGDRDLLRGRRAVTPYYVRGKKGFVTEVFLDQDRGQSHKLFTKRRLRRRWKSAIFAVSVTAEVDHDRPARDRPAVC